MERRKSHRLLRRRRRSYYHLPRLAIPSRTQGQRTLDFNLKLDIRLLRRAYDSSIHFPFDRCLHCPVRYLRFWCHYAGHVLFRRHLHDNRHWSLSNQSWRAAYLFRTWHGKLNLQQVDLLFIVF